MNRLNHFIFDRMERRLDRNGSLGLGRLFLLISPRLREEYRRLAELDQRLRDEWDTALFASDEDGSDDFFESNFGVAEYSKRRFDRSSARRTLRRPYAPTRRRTVLSAATILLIFTAAGLFFAFRSEPSQSNPTISKTVMTALLSSFEPKTIEADCLTRKKISDNLPLLLLNPLQTGISLSVVNQTAPVCGNNE